jgi:hypothetical protein
MGVVGSGGAGAKVNGDAVASKGASKWNSRNVRWAFKRGGIRESCSQGSKTKKEAIRVRELAFPINMYLSR